MVQQRFKGTGVALVTPFQHGKIDFPALQRVIEHTIHGNVDFLVSLGTTGESVTLTASEMQEILSFTVEVVNGRKPIVAGMFGDNNTARMIDRFKQVDLSGVTAIMSSNPAYSKPSQEGIYQHYMALANASPLPIIIYNVPGRTASNIEPDTILRLARASQKFIAVKEASGDVLQATYLLKHRPENFLVLSGDDPTTLPHLGLGGDGVISVIGNAFPKEFASMVRAALNNDFATARKLNALLFDLHPWLYVDCNPAGIKAVLAEMGICSTEVRLPLVPVSKSTLQGIQKELQAIRQLQEA